MSLFGGKEENQKLHAELARISALPLDQLAVEVMTKGFGPGGPADRGSAELGAVAGAFNPAGGMFLDDQALIDMASVVGEGVQVLEHACFVRSEVVGSGGVYHQYWSATRRGRTALEQGTVGQLLTDGSRQLSV